jgi:flagellar assembly factor FliW
VLQKVTFPVGLPAFPGKRDFRVEPAEGVPLARLAAEDKDGPNFIVLMAPEVFFPGLGPFDLDEQQAAAIGASERSKLVSWLILTVKPGSVTANLLGPVVVNLDNALAIQAARNDASLPVAAPLTVAELAHAK